MSSMFLGGASGLAILALIGSAQAQETQDTSSVSTDTLNDSPGATTRDVVVVTALRREQDVTDVPVAITTFSGDTLVRLGVDDPTILGDFTPGLSAIYNSVGAPAYTLRGVGLEDFIGNNTSGTAIYFDEVYPVSATQQGFQMFDLQRVEVLKGPQGTLYGRNASGGAINFIPNRPTDETEGYFTVSYDSLDELDLIGVVSGPLSDTARGRIAVNYTKGLDAWQDGQFGGADAGKADRLSARGQLEFDLSPDATALITVFGERDKGINTTWQADDQLDYLGATGIPVASSGRTDEASLGEFFTNIDGTASPRNDTSAYGATVKLNVGTGFGDITSITNYQMMDRLSYDNNDGSPEELADFRFDTDVEQFSQELRLNSEIGDRGNIIVGVFYGWDSIDVGDVATITGFLDVFGLPSPTPGGEATISVDATQDTTSVGVYLHSEWALNDIVQLTAAGRYTYEKRDFRGAIYDDQGFFFGAPGPIFPVFGLTEFLDFSETENNFSYRVGLDAKVTEDLLLYASVATGFKSGVFYSGPVFDPRGWGYIEPEKLRAYEAGGKLTTLGGAVQINLAAFYYDYKDKQTLVFIDDPFGAIATLGNVPEANAYGGELEITARPVEGLDLTAGLSILETEIDVAPTTVRGAPLLASVISGGELTQSPNVSMNFQGVYTAPISGNLLGRIQVSYAYSDKRTLFLSDPLSQSDTYNSLGARVSLLGNDEQWELSIFGHNLTNEEAVTLAFGNIIGNRTFALQKPRVIGGALNVRF
jgi:iron complex outermembrane recepter protein